LENIAQDHFNDFVKDADKQIQKASNTYPIGFNYLTPIVYLDVDNEKGIKLSLRHLINPKARRSITMLIWEDILDEFQNEKEITFTFPTYRIKSEK
ncbi:MAG: mechanosensitive ion channel family protein, partial [Balneolaceae bacterium]